MSTAIALVPHGLALPAHLTTPEAAAAIAEANAAASGGIKSGVSFPKISIKANKFHEIDPAIESGAARTYMVTANPGQPAMPMMCLEAVIIGANPAITKTYYVGDYVEGSAEAPNCQSSNGVVPDAHVVKKEHPQCADCPQNQWGSKQSKLSGKDIKACDDSKQLVILPGADLTYKALGLLVGKGSLKNFGKYVAELTGRNMPIASVVTNVTFDLTATGVLVFTFNRFLTPAEYEQAKARALGDDVKLITVPVRTIALPAPIAAPALPAPAAATPAPAPAYVPPPAPVAPPAPTTGFGATAAAPAQPAAQPPAPVPPAAPARKRRTRAEIEADEAAAKLAAGGASEDYSYLSPAIQAALAAVGPTTPAGIAMLAQFPKPQAETPPPAQQPATVVPPPATSTVATGAPGGFGATVTTPPAVPQQPAAGVTAAGADLKAALEKKLFPNGRPGTTPATA